MLYLEKMFTEKALLLLVPFRCGFDSSWSIATLCSVIGLMWIESTGPTFAFCSFSIGFDVWTNFGKWVLVSASYRTISSKTPYKQFFHNRCSPTSITDALIFRSQCDIPLAQSNIFFFIITRRPSLSSIVDEHSEPKRKRSGEFWTWGGRRCIYHARGETPFHAICANAWNNSKTQFTSSW